MLSMSCSWSLRRILETGSDERSKYFDSILIYEIEPAHDVMYWLALITCLKESPTPPSLLECGLRLGVYSLQWDVNIKWQSRKQICAPLLITLRALEGRNRFTLSGSGTHFSLKILLHQNNDVVILSRFTFCFDLCSEGKQRQIF